MSDELVWIDLETTGLDEDQGRILEVGCIVTAANLNIEGVFHAVVGPPLGVNEVTHLHPSVSAMHERNGLFAAQRDLANALAVIEEVDRNLAWWLFEQLPDGDLMLAGSSVHFDRKWMARHLPKSLELFHYRNADVSGLREFVRRWYPLHDEQMEQITQFKMHRSLPDLYDSITLASYYRGVIQRAAREDP